MTRQEAVKWLSNLKMDIGKTQHQELWHYEQALDEIMQALEKEPTTEYSSDVISRQDAIDAWWYDEVFFGNQRDDMTKEQWLDYIADVIGSIPSAQPERKTDGDTISRQDAIEAVHGSYDEILDFKSTGRTIADSVEDIISNLPSAQQEIIRCKDCKHLQKWRSEESAKRSGQIYTCARNVFSFPKPEDFCSFAERRADDE